MLKQHTPFCLPTREDEVVPVARLHALAEQVIALGKKAGADQVKVHASVSQGLDIEVHEQAVEQVNFQRDKALSVTVYQGHKKGTISTSDWSSDHLDQLIKRAMALCAVSEHDPCQGLAPEGMVAEPRDLEAFHPWHITVEDLILTTQELERSMRCDPRIQQSEGAQAHTGVHAVLYADSMGRAYHRYSSEHSMACMPIAQDEAGALERSYAYTADRHAERLMPLEALGQLACTRAVARLGGRPIPSQKVPVVFDASDMAASFLRPFCRALGGRAQYRGESFLQGILGKSCFPQWMNINEKPWEVGDLYASWFDAEGVPTRPAPVLTQGVVNTYFLNLYAARRLNMTPTGHAGGWNRLRVSHTHPSQEALLQAIGTGLLVTEMMGGGENPITGDYSRGVSGFWVEDGAISFPVKTVTVAGNLKEAYQHLIGIADDANHLSELAVGSIATEGLTVAGV